MITIDELNLYVKERVKELTGGLQHPVDLKPKEQHRFLDALSRGAYTVGGLLFQLKIVKNRIDNLRLRR